MLATCNVDLGAAWLCRACSSGRPAAVRALVETGRTPLEIRDGQGATPLYVAASTDQQQICLYLLSKGADVEVRLPLSLLSADLASFKSEFENTCRAAHTTEM